MNYVNYTRALKCFMAKQIIKFITFYKDYLDPCFMDRCSIRQQVNIFILVLWIQMLARLK